MIRRYGASSLESAVSTKPEDERRQADNPLWDVVGWAVFEGAVLIVRGIGALIAALFSLVTD